MGKELPTEFDEVGDRLEAGESPDEIGKDIRGLPGGSGSADDFDVGVPWPVRSPAGTALFDTRAHVLIGGEAASQDLSYSSRNVTTLCRDTAALTECSSRTGRSSRIISSSRVRLACRIGR